MKEYIRDYMGRVLGYTEETNSKITIYNQLGRELGFYDKRTKESWMSYPSRKLISREGNMISSLLTSSI